MVSSIKTKRPGTEKKTRSMAPRYLKRKVRGGEVHVSRGAVEGKRIQRKSRVAALRIRNWRLTG